MLPLSPRRWVAVCWCWGGRFVRGSVLVAVLTVAVGVVVLPGPWDGGLASAAGGAEPRVVGEVVSLRGARSATFARSDGSFATRLSEQSVHWFDRASGSWRVIDAGLSASAKPGVGWESGSNRFSVELAGRSGEGLVSFVSEGGRMGFGLEGATAGKAGVRDGGNAVLYAGVLPNVDVEYAVLPDGLKESVVLRKPGVPSSYRFRLEPAAGVKWRAEELGKGGSWAFFADGAPEPEFVLLPPSVGDSDFEPPLPVSLDVVPRIVDTAAGMASLEVSAEKDGSFVATVSIDEKWLSDPERVFPVVVDPTVWSQPDVADGWYDVVNGGNPVIESAVTVGPWGVGAPNRMGVVTFDVGSIPPSASVSAASVNMFMDSCYPGSCGPNDRGTVRMRRLSHGWSASTPWSVISGSIDATTLAQVSWPYPSPPLQQWYGWSGAALTTAVQGMVNGSTANYGFIFDESQGNDWNGWAFRSSRWSDPSYAPYMEVTWSGDGVQIDPALSVHSDGAELRWQHYPAGPITGFKRFEIHRSASAGFTPSAATLAATLKDDAWLSYRDTGAKAGGTFFYRVVTVIDTGGGETTFSSNEVQAVLPAAGQATVTVQPGYISSSAKGAHIASGAPTTNYGNSQSLVIGSAGGSNTRTLLQFDMRAIPTGVTVSSAEIQLYALQATSASVVNAHRLAAEWWEGGATWNQRDNNTGLNWSTAGGDFDAGSLGTNSAAGSLAWVSVPITSLVQEWVNGGKSQLGVVLKYGSESGSQPTLSFAADGFFRSVALRPKLVVTFADGSSPAAPTVAVSRPAAGELVKGTVTVAAGALDDGSVKQVEFFDGATPIGSPDTSAPYQVSWTTNGRGSSSLTAKATDEAGNVTTSTAVAVTRANSAAPTTSITSATDGGGGVWTVNASASDDVGVTSVEFFVDGERFAADNSSPYSATLDTFALPVYDGAHDVTTRANDADGQVTTSAVTSITVDNASDFEASFQVSGVPLELAYDPGRTQLAYPISVMVTNTGGYHLSTASMKLRYRWFDASGAQNTPAPADVTIPGPALATGESTTMQLSLAPPTLPTGVDRARYRLQLDIYDESRTQTFSSLGSKPFETWLTVTRVTADELGLERYQTYDGEDLGGGFANSVNLANGNSVVRWTPLAQPGRGLDTVVSFAYNSREHGSVSPVGNNWSLAVSSLTAFGLPLDIHPNTADTAAGRTQKWVGLTDADGSYHRFTGNTGGTYYTPPAGVQLYLKQTGSGWEAWKPDRTRFVYDTAGFPTKVADANGNELTFTLATPAAGEDPYGLAKRVTTITDAGGRTFTLGYWAKAEVAKSAMRGRLKSITDHVGHKLELSYYEDGNLRSLTEKGGPGDDGMPTPDRTAYLAYTNQAGTGPAIATLAGRQNPFPGTTQSPKLYSLIDFKGQETQFEYATSGTNTWRVTGRTNRLGTAADKTTFAYPTATTATVTKPLSRVWQYTFDSQARVTQITNPLSQSTQVQWTTAVPLNYVARVTQPSGKHLDYAYNANGYPTSQKDELGDETTFTYASSAVDANDVSGNWESGRSIGHISDLASVTKPRGNATAGNPSDYKWTFSYTQTPGDSTTGLVKTITDPLGNVTSNTWNANATLATQTLPANGDAITRTTTYNTYDANGLPTKITDAAGGVAEASYRADGLPVLERDPVYANGSAPSDQDSSKRYYDAYGRERRASSPKSSSLTPGLLVWASQSYDLNDNVTASQAPHYGRGDGANGATTTTAFDPLDRPTLDTGPRAAADGGPTGSKTEYDAGGRIIRVTQPKGVNTTPSGSAYLNDFVVETSYDLLDRPLAATDYAVDGSGNVDTAKSRTTKSCYDLAGDLRSTTAPKGSAGLGSCPNPAATPYVYTSATHTTKYEYDDAHRLKKTTDPAANVTQLGYDENSAVTSTTDQLDKVTTTSYNDRGDRVTQVVPFDTGRTLTTKWEIDNLGNVKRLISPRAYDAAGGGPTFTDYVESYAYDALQRPVKTTLPAAAGTTQAYVHNAYDANGRLSWTSLPTTAATAGAVTSGEKTQTGYWDSGQLYWTQDPANSKVRFDYTAQGWQTSRIPELVGSVGTLDLSRAMYWQYLPDGLTKALLDEGGERARYSYDADGNQTQATEATGLVQVGQAPLLIDLSYSSLDELAKVRTPKPGSSNYLASYLGYDLHGNAATLEDNREETSGGSTVTAGRVFAFVYDNLDRATGQTDDFASGGTSDDEQLLYTYTSRGELGTQTLQMGGSGAWVTEQAAVRTYFDNGQLKMLTNRNAAGAVVEQHTLSYISGGVYLNGGRASDVFQLKGPDAAAACYSATCTASWTYDARDRLTQEVNGTGTTTVFTLDAVGNVIGEAPSGGTTITRTYNGQQLATQASGGTTEKFLYDAYGNQDCKVKSAYAASTCPGPGSDLLEDWVYDYKSRLAAYRSYDGSGGLVTTVSYTNDPLDRPVQQTSTESGSTTSYAFTYIGVTDLLSTETLTGATSATRRYAYDALGRRATMTDGASRYSYLYDPHGSVSLLVDQTGAPKASYGYGAYGNPNAALTKTAAGFSPGANVYRYTGKRTDSGSATLDMGARRYTPATGRFLQYDYYDGSLANLGLTLDPLSRNRYALAAGNPVNFVETDGHMAMAVDGDYASIQQAIQITQQEIKQWADDCNSNPKMAGCGGGGGFTGAIGDLYGPSGLKAVVDDCFGNFSAGRCVVAGAMVAPAGKGVRSGSLAIKLGKNLAKGKKAAKAADEAFHYTRSELAALIEKEGLRPGSYLTKTGKLSPLQAQLDLALPPNRGLADAVIRVDLAGLRKAGYEVGEFTTVGRKYNMPGGGTELRFSKAIPSRFLKVVRR